ncbi:DUF1573 domain-containing protein [Membranihabitans maritimus]|uniref:DUF1573 domain-containing protein n=1 Tax=Membranihabitans maritimus TaxID=2904244 RepID=UPI001F23CC3F|nr:DUF1573 domain-containing protein [Membranihabitans maritimus]
MKYLRYIILSFILLQSGYLISQPLSEIPLRFKIEAADSAYFKNDYYNALEWYNEVYREERNVKYMSRIAELYYKIRDYKRAERWYARLLDKDAEGDYPLARLNYGKVLKSNGKYNESAIVFQEIQEGMYSDSITRVADVELQGINMAERLKSPENIEVVNLGTRINTRNSEGTPIPVSGGNLFFTSFGENKLLQEGEDVNRQSKVFSAQMNSDGEFTRRAQPVEGVLRGDRGHIGNVFVTPDGRRMYFTYFTLSGSKIESGAIYYSQGSGRGWSSPQKVEGLPTNGIVKNPSVGNLSGREVLFFAYDGGSSLGGFDIFYAPLNAPNEAGNTIPLGAEINTPGNEISPIFLSNTLYFSSDGHPSMGGFDIISALWTGDSWTRVENIGKGVNSTLDETYYYPPTEEMNAYLVSNRQGTRSIQSSTCCDDIYKLDNKEIIVRLLATVFDGETPLNEASISVFPVVENEWGSPDVQYNPEGNDFTFSIDADKAYQVLVSREGYISDTVGFNTVGVTESKDFKGVFRLDKLPVEEEPEVISKNEPIRLNNIYYDFDDDRIKMEAEQDLDFLYNLLTDYPTMVIELSSHTDSRGNDPYNMDLSQRRANSAKRYLVERGIDENRVQAVGYGENRLLNHCSNGVDCSEEEHLLNRRTEFTIIEGPTSIPVQSEKKKVRKREDTNTGEGSSDASGMPKVEFGQNDYDFGELKKGSKKTSEISFKNTGTAPLVIEVASGCDCSTLNWPRTPVDPGASGTLEVIYDSTEQDLGVQEVTVDVLANTEPPISSVNFTIKVVE